MILYISAIGSIIYLKKPEKLTNCYLPNCTIRLTEANSSICIDLESANNQECNVLQDGINVTVNLVLEKQQPGQPVQTSTQTLFGYYYGFNYTQTKTICIDSDNPPNTGGNFYLASSSQVILNSISYTNTFAPGLIQRISGDNSQFLNDSTSEVYFGPTSLCANSILTSSYIKNFNISNIINASLVITNYHGSGKRGNFTVNYDPLNPSQNSLIQLDYDAQTNNFTFCYKQRGLKLYPYLDISTSSAFLYLYYQVDQFPGKGKLAVYQQGIILNYNYPSLAEVFEQINLVVMSDNVAIQSILSSDPTLLAKAQQYEQNLKKHPNNVGMRLAYIYCSNNGSQFSSAYNSHPVGFSNVSQLLNQNLYGPNKSVVQNVLNLWDYNQKGCKLAFQYQMFALQDGDVLESYLQSGNLAYYTCFEQVKYAADGDLTFVRNEQKCPRFEKPATVYFSILDLRTRYSAQQIKINNFSTQSLTYTIQFEVKIDSENYTLQILNEDMQMVDMVEFFSVTEVSSKVAVDKIIVVVIFGALQTVSLALFVILDKKVVPKIKEKIYHKKQMIMKMKSAMMDL